MGKFKGWIKKQRDREDPIGDLARDIIVDKEFPRDAQFCECLAYLRRAGACDKCIEAFYCAWEECHSIIIPRDDSIVAMIFDELDDLINMALDNELDDDECRQILIHEPKICKENRRFIYALCDPETLEIRYIGQAKNLRKRFLNHIFHSHSKKITIWIGDLLKQGRIPLMFLLYECTTENINEMERQFCYYAKLINCQLLNAALTKF